MRSTPLAADSCLDLHRLRLRIVWIPTATLMVLILLYDIFEIIAEESWSTETLVAHMLLLLLVSGGGFAFSTHTLHIIRHNHEEIRRQRQALTSMERKSLALLEESSDLIVLMRADGTVTYASPAVTRAL
jgi:PAS domain-containing protein